jgi:hypothetical protein
MRVWSAFLVLGSILGVASAVVVFLPSVSVSYGDLTDPVDLLSAPITVKNDGIVRLKDVGIGLGLCGIDFGKNADKRGEQTKEACKSNGKLNSILKLTAWQHHTLVSGENYSISLHDLFKTNKDTNAQYADISIVVDYRPWYWPFGMKPKQVRIVGQKDADDHFAWRFRPLDDE